MYLNLGPLSRFEWGVYQQLESKYLAIEMEREVEVETGIEKERVV